MDQEARLTCIPVSLCTIRMGGCGGTILWQVPYSWKCCHDIWSLFNSATPCYANNALTCPVGLIDGSRGASTNGTYTKNGLTWSADKLRMNQIQVIATHNSYHREVSLLSERLWHYLLLSGPKNYYYSHAALDLQAEHQGVRSFELDIWADPKGGNYATPLVRRLSNTAYPPQDIMRRPGAKVMHASDLDVGVTCYTLIECLVVLRNWSVAHPRHVPLSIQLEFKTARRSLGLLGGASRIAWNDSVLLASLDNEIRSVFAADELIVPDDLRRSSSGEDGGSGGGGGSDLTLEESVLAYGWPDLDSARGRFLFVMDDGPVTLGSVRDTYIQGRPNLEGRVIFSQSAPGQSDCAFQKLNTPNGDAANQANIQQQVARGYWVRTRADIPLTTVLSNDTATMRDAAFASGAQMISTDWPVVGMSSRYGVDYAVRFAGGKPARCNPVNAPDACTDETELEPPEYYQG